ncbi:MAG: hypothetical protein JWM05_3035 [Acidimicrobiales bacterium]|nr:hypothetical protein [Acidimicrobiales bacterium]
MASLHWSHRPTLRRPVVLAAFEGWNDAGDAATTAARWLGDRLGARPFATIDSEEFFDFTSVRPIVELVDGETRHIAWPDTRLIAAKVPHAPRDLVIAIGHEPQLRWRTFCATIMEVAEALDAEMVVTLGALLAEVPHSRPTSVIGTGHDHELVQQLGLEPSTYEGPTGITGVLHAACRDAGLASVSLWAAVPTYVPGAPSPKAALALVERTTELLSIPISTTDLEIAAAAYERQIDELVSADEDTAAYVARLEEEADAEDDEVGDTDELAEIDDAQSDMLVAEVERFLRRQDGR